MKIVAVAPDSPLAGRVTAGCEIISVNGSEIIDTIDFRFKTSEENLKIIFSKPEGEMFEIRFNNNDVVDLGLDFEDDKVKTCNNNCIFCFVRQQPKGMRPALYVKDEDYRLSFTHGNFITLSNISSKEYERIIPHKASYGKRHSNPCPGCFMPGYK